MDVHIKLHREKELPETRIKVFSDFCVLVIKDGRNEISLYFDNITEMEKFIYDILRDIHKSRCR